ncbi:hypothetical protein GRI75_12725 [Altererythrobacter soli]|uniref:Uncharacterized protein n=1 Tax=Croceibacterium soli TaxID=1739690 RepID=A0A6I4UX62_9SPHN|nr:hypothetical protein [Croceibacterium soli]MXP42504.1 hypothetical protein [Croceibacterium soli]
MEPQVLLEYLPWLIGGGFVVAMAGTWGWVHTTKLKIKHGYPLEGMWGQALRPSTDAEAKERIKLLTQENAQLRAEIGSLQDRMANVERIVTDSGYHIGHEIERLRDQGEKVQ